MGMITPYSFPISLYLEFRAQLSPIRYHIHDFSND